MNKVNLAELKTRHQMQSNCKLKEEAKQPVQNLQCLRTTPKLTQKLPKLGHEKTLGLVQRFNAMTYTAFDLHRKLTEEEGFGSSI